MSTKLRNSAKSTGAYSHVTKYADEIERLTGNGVSAEPVLTFQFGVQKADAAIGSYNGRSLHRLLSNYLLEEVLYPKTILNEKSGRGDSAQKWVHPDVMAVECDGFQNELTRALPKTVETKEYLEPHSYEMERTITHDHELKGYFFQALTNNSWANFGYLAALEVGEDVKKRLAGNYEGFPQAGKISGLQKNHIPCQKKKAACAQSGRPPCRIAA